MHLFRANKKYTLEDKDSYKDKLTDLHNGESLEKEQRVPLNPNKDEFGFIERFWYKHHDINPPINSIKHEAIDISSKKASEANKYVNNDIIIKIPYITVFENHLAPQKDICVFCIRKHKLYTTSQDNTSTYISKQ